MSTGAGAGAAVGAGSAGRSAWPQAETMIATAAIRMVLAFMFLPRGYVVLRPTEYRGIIDLGRACERDERCPVAGGFRLQNALIHFGLEGIEPAEKAVEAIVVTKVSKEWINR